MPKAGVRMYGEREDRTDLKGSFEVVPMSFVPD